MFDSERGRSAVNARWNRYREKRAEVEREAKERAVAALVEAADRSAQTMVALLDSPNDRVRHAAARDILDRLPRPRVGASRARRPRRLDAAARRHRPGHAASALRELMGPSSADA